MAELANGYLADQLDSRRLLALLYVCESIRKKTMGRLSTDGEGLGPVWKEFVDRFAARLENLPEAERAYLIGSHLQSAEEIDLYSNDVIQRLLDNHQGLLKRLVDDLASDSRFAVS